MQIILPTITWSLEPEKCKLGHHSGGEEREVLQLPDHPHIKGDAHPLVVGENKPIGYGVGAPQELDEDIGIIMMHPAVHVEKEDVTIVRMLKHVAI